LYGGLVEEKSGKSFARSLSAVKDQYIHQISQEKEEGETSKGLVRGAEKKKRIVLRDGNSLGIT